jgi:hypothetical protein
MDKEYILDEIRRTAGLNGGTPLGRLRLEKEAGIKEHHWRKYWPRFGDAQKEAGLAPNQAPEAWQEAELIQHIVTLCRELGRFPTHADIRVKGTYDAQFPSHRIFDRRLGRKADIVRKVVAYCGTHAGHDDVQEMCREASAVENERTDADAGPDAIKDGFVYLLKSGRFYKIGKTNHVGRRERELSIQLPEQAKRVHEIRTDDPEGIEVYWHWRFDAKRKNGEWFELSKEDDTAFRRRKFM